VELVIHPRCETEALDSWRYYELKQEGLGRRFLAEVDTALQRLQPTLNTTHSLQQHRDLVVRKFPFVIIYQIIG